MQITLTLDQLEDIIINKMGWEQVDLQSFVQCVADLQRQEAEALRREASALQDYRNRRAGENVVKMAADNVWEEFNGDAESISAEEVARQREAFRKEAQS